MDFWNTTSMTALPPGFTVTTQQHGKRTKHPAIALLHQTRTGTSWEGNEERIMLGVLNTTTGEVQPVTKLGELVDIWYPDMIDLLS